MANRATLAILAALTFATAALAQTPSGGAGRDQAAPTVQMPSGPVLSEEEIRQRLEKDGYSSITEIRRQGPSYEAKAVRDGKPVNLTVDARTGSVRSTY